MFIAVCLQCYDGKKGRITGVNRIDEDEPPCVVCGEPLYLVYTSKNPGGGSGDYKLISESLAINPVQTKAHRKLFPGVEVFSDGRLQFNSFRQHDRYLKQTGFVKHTQKIKPKGKRVTPIATGN